MINFIVIFFQFLITFLIGRTFYIFIEKKLIKNSNKKIFGLQPYSFYLLFGLFVIGNLTVLINFFTGSNNIIFQIFLILIAGVNIFYFPEIKKISFPRGLSKYAAITMERRGLKHCGGESPYYYNLRPCKECGTKKEVMYDVDKKEAQEQMLAIQAKRPAYTLDSLR